MEFHIFVEKVVATLKESLGEAYEIQVTEVVKNNNIHLTGVVITKRPANVSPTIYLNQYYQKYQEEGNFQQTVGEMMALYEQQAKELQLDMSFFTDFTQVKERLYHKLVHYEKNKKMLEDVPHIRWNDLAVVFYYAMEQDVVGRTTITIRKEHLAIWKQEEGMLFAIAQENMRRDMPELLVPMKELLEEMTGVELEKQYDVPMYVLTNKEKIFGASVLLYSEKLQELAEKTGKNLLILPSSVHEVLLMPDEEDREYGFYRQMVEEVNTTQVDPEEVLSYSLYCYDRQKKEIKEIFS